MNEFAKVGSCNFMGEVSLVSLWLSLITSKVEAHGDKGKSARSS